MKKTISAVVAAVVVIALVCGLFYYVTLRSKPSAEDHVELSKVQKLTTSNFEINYPATPREVVKVFNKIMTCFYNEDCTEEELEKLVEQAWILFDPKLQENNPLDVYLTTVKAEIAEYKERGRTISQSDVCASNDVKYKTDGTDKLAYVDASYFVKESKQYTNTYQMYVLRKDAEGRWRILVFYQIKKEKAKDDE